MIRIAVVGTGIIAKAHFNAIEALDNCMLAAISEINEELARETGEKYNVPYYTDYKEMTDKEDFDAVILNLPHFLHCEVTEYFLAHDIHVLCEKPMANTVEECDRMLAAEAESNAKLAIGHIQRFFTANDIVKQYVDNKKLGELCMTTEFRNAHYFNSKRPKWFKDKKLAGGGILMNYGAHAFDKLLYIVGSDFTDISSVCDNFLPGYDIEGHAQVRFTIDGRVSTSVTFCGYSSFSGCETTYYFTNGALKIINFYNLEICDEPNGKFRKYEYDEPVPPLTKQLAEFLKLVEGKESTIVRGDYGKKIIEVIQEIYSQNE